MEQQLPVSSHSGNLKIVPKSANNLFLETLNIQYRLCYSDQTRKRYSDLLSEVSFFFFFGGEIE